MKLAIECILCKKLIEIPVENVSDINDSVPNIIKSKKLEIFELIINDCRDSRCVLYGYICKDCYNRLAHKEEKPKKYKRYYNRYYKPYSYNRYRKPYKYSKRKYGSYYKNYRKKSYDNNNYIEPEYDSYYEDEEQR